MIGKARARIEEISSTCLRLSTKVMNERLNKMMRFGIVQRTVIGQKPPLEVQYTLTSFGNRFNDLIEQVRRLLNLVFLKIAN